MSSRKRAVESRMPYWVELARSAPARTRLPRSCGMRHFEIPRQVAAVCGQRSVPVSPP